MNSLQKELTLLGSPNEIKVATLLAEKGLSHNRVMHNEIVALMTDFPKVSPFALSFIQSLFWARYAKKSNKFVQLVLNYFESDKQKIDEKLVSNLEKYMLQYESLKEVVVSGKVLINKLSLQIPRTYTIDSLLLFQDKWMNALIKSTHSKEISHLGAWLCYAPFKVLALWKDEFWDNKELDKLILPLGGQVVRGINWIHRNVLDVGYGISEVEETNLEDSISTTMDAMSIQTELAKAGNTRVLHINTGLFLLGAKKDI